MSPEPADPRMEAFPLPMRTDLRLAGPDTAQTSSDAAPARGRPRREWTRAARQVRPRRGWYLSGKYLLDLLACSLLLPPVLLVIALAALLVKLTSWGPAFYTQVRVGRGGRLFTIIKIRTMLDNCESLTGPRWSMPGDPRVTRIGRILRVTHLDELPQLWNVLRGDMSLVGPRPERPEFLPELEEALPAYRERLLVRPGISGLAQVRLPADSDLDSVRRKLAHDLFYVENMRFGLDCRLLACTACYALGVPFRVAGWLLRIPASAAVETAMRDLVAVPPSPRVRKSA
jgi:lipopolysaccharide/colanic/teichoic acid biosynthesis glycosyltransferase